MEQTNQTRPDMAKIKTLFNQILAKHAERLIGTMHGIAGLPLDIDTISMLVVLAEREADIGTSPLPLERYDKESLLSELGDIGLTEDEDLETAFQSLIQRKYMETDGNGHLLTNKPTMNMVQLLDHVFKGMAGLNLVAYFVQTLDEVVSGRKDLDSAAGQFHQTLQMKGVPLRISKKQPPPEEPPKPARAEAKPEDSARISTEQQPPQPKRVKPQPVSPQAPAPHQVEVGPEAPAHPPVHAEEIRRPPEMDEHVPPIAAEKEPAVQREGAGKILEPPGTGPDSTVIQAVPESAQKQAEETAAPRQTEQKTEPKYDHAEEEKADLSPDEHITITDDIIANRIAAFEQDLSMACPICKTGKVQVQHTAKDKPFYICSSRDCNFISWGKPHYLPCPLCKNPFLIEVSEPGSDVVLKCPRATCHYLSRPPKEGSPAEDIRPPDPATAAAPLSADRPRKKVVVRRRLVRKKQ
ncbi:MAG: hypothetical protein V1736_05075 [Pseudomonadota bacterium]